MAIDWTTTGGQGMLCQRCQGTEAFTIPATVRQVVKQMQAFNRKHAQCKKLAGECPDCGAHRVWLILSGGGIRAWCKYCGRRGCHDDLKSYDLGGPIEREEP